ncbi:MAG TPA: hypothetical protein VMV94_09970, partial [Phycisphaerae bacterium]|nr:hypothetical protein [Phycisphaerae bacterium]
MKPSLRILAASLTLLAAVGCIPEKRIAWSPDGERAAVMAEDGLYFIDAAGNVKPPHVALASARCVWFPDGHRLLVKHTITTHNWADIKPLFSEQEATRIEDEAKTLRERILAYQGDWKTFEFDPGKQFAPGSEVGILLCLRDKYFEGVPEKVGSQWGDLEKANADVTNLQVFTLTDTDLQPGATLLRSLNPVASMLVSPDSRRIAFVMPIPEGTEHPASLYVLPVEGGSPRLVTSDVAARFDWSPDARSLAVIRSASGSHDGPDNIQLGLVTTVTVADENGALLEEWAA